MATMEEKEKMHRGLKATEQAKSEKKEEEKERSTLDQIKEGVGKFLEGIPRGGRILDNTDMYKKGGQVKKKIDGCAVRGKTKGRMV